MLGETGTQLMDGIEDTRAGEIVGQSTADKEGNVMTQVGIVLSLGFMPGPRWTNQRWLDRGIIRNHDDLS